MRNSSFSLRIAEVMGEENLTQANVAKSLHVSQTTVSRWLSGSVPRKQKATLLAKVLGVEVDWLLTGNGLKRTGSTGLTPLENKELESVKAYTTDTTNLEVLNFNLDGKNSLPIRLRWLRESLGLSLAEFAQRIGYDTSYISKLESASRINPSMKFMESVVVTFCVRRDWLFHGLEIPFGISEEVFDKSKFDFLKSENPRALLNALNASFLNKGLVDILDALIELFKTDGLAKCVSNLFESKKCLSSNTRRLIKILVKQLNTRIDAYPQDEGKRPFTFETIMPFLEWWISKQRSDNPPESIS